MDAPLALDNVVRAATRRTNGVSRRQPLPAGITEGPIWQAPINLLDGVDLAVPWCIDKTILVPHTVTGSQHAARVQL